MIKFVPAVMILLMTYTGYSQPKLTINVTGGYSLPLPQLKGDITDSTAREGGNSYFMKTGFNLGLTGKYAVDKKGRIRITLGGAFNKFSVNESYVHTNNVEVHSSISIISGSLGAEYSFTPKEKTRPYLGLELTGNFFSGKTEEIVTAATVTEHGDLGTTTSTLKSASRFGISAGGGVDVDISKKIGAVFGFKYHLANLIGKDYISSSAAGEYNLNDKENGTVKARNISFIQIFLGFSFSLGHPKKTVKK
ncbi:MAG: outer membrane beta-barrel protein [Ignavibacteria bacterium]|nr:outer membrane beta-barrel protein [Ignavibacteria bacterium]